MYTCPMYTYVHTQTKYERKVRRTNFSVFGLFRIHFGQRRIVSIHFSVITLHLGGLRSSFVVVFVVIFAKMVRRVFGPKERSTRSVEHKIQNIFIFHNLKVLRVCERACSVLTLSRTNSYFHIYALHVDVDRM